MNKYLIATIVTLLFLVGGSYLYANSQKKENFSPKEEDLPAEHGGGNTSGMSNQPVVQSHRSYEIEALSNTNNIQPSIPIEFKYRIKSDKGEILKSFEIVHEKIMHFVAVRKDLQNFQHLHPDFNQATGEFSIDVTFPTDGAYRVFPDFTPAEDNPQKLPVTVYHDMDVGENSKYKAQPVIPDTQPKKTVGEYQITYNFLTEIMMRNEINYSLSIEKSGQRVKDLENYLGALGHSVILKEGSLDFIHTHAEEINAYRGPEIKFSTSFPKDGVYKIFTQLQHKGRIVTTDYVLKVNE